MIGKQDRERLAKALGANVVVDVGKGGDAGPLDVFRLRRELQERLRSSGGRPTDPTWTLARQIPFKPESWLRLKELAREIGTQGRRVGAAQLAAVLVEHGIEELEVDRWSTVLQASRAAAPLPASEAAEAAGVPFKQLEVWRREGFVSPARIESNGRRWYSIDEIVRMTWLRYAMQYGFERDDAMSSIKAVDLGQRYAVTVEPIRCETVPLSRLAELIASHSVAHVFDQMRIRLNVFGEDDEEGTHGDVAAKAV